MLSLNCRLGDAQQCSLLLLLREMYTCVCKHMLYWHVCWRRVGDRGSPNTAGAGPAAAVASV